MSLISICGAQGQGKSTVLAALSECGYNVIPHKTSRAILTEWNYTLDEIHKDPELTKTFQDEILIRHEQNNAIALNSDKIYFTERSHADIFTYTVFALGSFNEYTEWLSDYYHKCKDGHRIYDSVIKLGGVMSNPENDGVRSVNKHFSNSIDIILDYYLHDFDVPVIEIDTADHDTRIDIILDCLR